MLLFDHRDASEREAYEFRNGRKYMHQRMVRGLGYARER